MTSTEFDDRRLAGLHAPRRNRHYAGKLLAMSDLGMEQDYLRGADAQLARHVLGAGVVRAGSAAGGHGRAAAQLIGCLAARVEECCGS
jgi:hypothetical protein